MLKKISYLGKFWFMSYGPNCSGPIRLQNFLIIRRTLKLAVSHEETNGINWYLVCPFSRMASYDFLIFDTMVDNLNIEKLTNPFFPRKFIFVQIWTKRAKNGPKVGFFWIF